MRQIYISLLYVSQQSMIVLRIPYLFLGGRCISAIINHASSRKAPKGQSLPPPPRPPLSLPLAQLYLPPYWAPSSSPLLLRLPAPPPEQKKHRQQKNRSPWNKRLQLHILRLKTPTWLHLMAPLISVTCFFIFGALTWWTLSTHSHHGLYIQKITLNVNLTNWFVPTKFCRNFGYPDVFNHP